MRGYSSRRRPSPCPRTCRPALALLSAKAVGAQPEVALPGAVAVYVVSVAVAPDRWLELLLGGLQGEAPRRNLVHADNDDPLVAQQTRAR